MGREMGGRVKREGIYVSDQIRSVAQSCPTLCDPMNLANSCWGLKKTTKFCKAIILQLKNKLILKSKINDKKRSVVFVPPTVPLKMGGLVTPSISRPSCLKYNVPEMPMLVRIYAVTIAIKLLDQWVKKSPWKWFSNQRCFASYQSVTCQSFHPFLWKSQTQWSRKKLFLLLPVWLLSLHYPWV